MTREEWLAVFAKELAELRPHLGRQFARSVAITSLSALGLGYEPQKAALEYHMRQEQLAADKKKGR